MPSLVELWATPVDGFPALKHLSTQVHGLVFSYSEDGLQTNPVTAAERPKEVVELGTTNKSLEDVVNFAYKLVETEFKTYNVATKNCIHFANKLSNYLCEKDIPYRLLHQVLTKPELVPFMPLVFLASTVKGVSGSSGKSSSNECSVS